MNNIFIVNVLFILIFAGAAVGLFFWIKFSNKINKSLYLASTDITGKIIGKSDSQITEIRNKNEHLYDVGMKWGPFIITFILMVIGLIKFNIKPKDEKTDQFQLRMMISSSIIGFAFLFFIFATINFFTHNK
jgi:hypothetical protein